MKVQALTPSEIAAILERACAKREPLRSSTNALRLVNSQGDDLPGIVVEQYGRHFVIHDFHKASETALESVIEYFRRHYDPEYLIVKHRYIEGGKEHDNRNIRVILHRSESQTIVTENGLRFHVDLNNTLNTGLFLDMRRTRKMVSELSRKKEVLNCFAYSCSFGVYCRAAKASRVVNIDVSAKILDKGKKNYALNGLNPREHEFVLADALRYLKGAAKRDNRFDCIILDPPTFARYQGKVFSITQAMPELLCLAFSILKPGGNLLVATNCSAISGEMLKNEVLQCSKQAGREIKLMLPLEQDEDFPGSGTMKESFLSCMLVKTGPNPPCE
ncbi:MAG: class I SAM-dependent methyltransferase [Fibrobacterota bacterium]